MPTLCHFHQKNTTVLWTVIQRSVNIKKYNRSVNIKKYNRSVNISHTEKTFPINNDELYILVGIFG